MKTFLQNLFLRLQLKKSLKELAKREIEHHTRIKTVAILTDTNTIIDTQFIKEIASQLNISPTKVNVMAPAKIAEIENPKQTQMLFYDQKELSWSAELSEQQERFCNTSFDILINYFNLPERLLSVLSARSKANFRVGFNGPDPQYNDLIFDFKPTEKKLFLNEFPKYIRTIFKTDS